MNWGWIKKRKLSAFFIFLFFSLYGLLVRHLNIFSLVCVDRHGRAVVYRRQLTPEVCCSQDPLTFWYTLQHPQGQKNETRAPASSCPINCCRTSETVGQLPAPTWVSITGSDRSIWQEHCPADCPSSLSLWSICTSIGPALVGDSCSSAACQKEPGATEEVQISSNGLDPDGCAHDNRPPCLWFGFLSVRNAEATTITQQNYACGTSTIDMLKSTAICYDN